MNEIVSAWGDNSNGQLGDGSSTEHHAPAPVKGLDRVRKIAAGSGHAVALLDDGTAVSWGRNAFGQLGDGTTENQSLPTEIKLDGIADVVPGGGQTLFLRTDGTVWGCGAGFFGLLGPDNLGLAPVPVKVDTPGGIAQLVCGGGHALVLLEDGAVWSWGRNDVGQLGDGEESGKRPGSRIQEHAGRTYPARPVPAQVKGLGPMRYLGAGGGHSLAVDENGGLYGWGDNDRGQLGDGTTEHQYAAVRSRVDGVTAVTGAYHHTLALIEDGTVLAFGMNDRGQLGNGTTKHSTAPVRVQDLSNVKQVATTGGGGEQNPGDFGHNLAVLEDGSLWAWGCNDHGELGDGTTEGRLTPVPVAAVAGVRQMTVGGEVPAFRENPGGGYALAIHTETRS